MSQSFSMQSFSRRSFIKGAAAFAAIGAFGLTGCSSEKSVPFDREIDQDSVVDSYIFCYPLMLVDAYATVKTNTVSATDQRAPYGQYIHAKSLVDASAKDLVMREPDVLYSQVFLNLSEQAQLLTFPRTDRYCNVEIMDAYTNCIYDLDCTAIDGDSETVVLYYSESESQPKKSELTSATKLESLTSLVWVLVRIGCAGESQLKDAAAVQDQMTITALDDYLAGKTTASAAGTYSAENDFDPVDYLNSLDVQAFFDRANELMVLNPPASEDFVRANKMKAINIGAGLTFDAVGLDDDDWATLKETAYTRSLKDCEGHILDNGCWSLYGTPVSNWRVAYYYRYIAALDLFGAAPLTAVVCYKTAVGDSAETLSGDQKFVLHFDTSPVTSNAGFWTLAAYSSDDVLMKNGIALSCTGSMQSLSFNEDGSFDIYVQQEQPSDQAELANWLPVGSGEYYLFLRMYSADRFYRLNQWNMPTVTSR